jgi:hypothetical protein
MSRSHKRTPVYKDGGRNGKFLKRQANRKVRKTKEVGGKSKNYRKLYESWNISDYRFYEPKTCDMNEDELQWWMNGYYRK